MQKYLFVILVTLLAPPLWGKENRFEKIPKFPSLFPVCINESTGGSFGRCLPPHRVPRCGDERINRPDETCDGESFCRTNCTFCGDGVLDAGEICDDGNSLAGDGCTPDCQCEPGPPPPTTCPGSTIPWPEQCRCLGETPWTRSYGSDGTYERGVSIAVDSEGTTYALSLENFVGRSPRFQNAVVRQIDACGGLVWERQLSGIGVFSVDNLSIDRCGNSYIVGTSGNGWFMRTSLTRINHDGAIDPRWSRLFSAPSGHSGRGVTVDGEGNVYLTGTTCEASRELFEEAWSDGLNPWQLFGDLWVEKLDPTGGVVWYRTYNGPAGFTDGGVSLHVDDSGNVYLLGLTTLPHTANPSRPGELQELLIQYDREGTLQTAVPWPWVGEVPLQTHAAYRRGLARGTDGNLYLATASPGRLLEKFSTSGEHLGTLILDEGEPSPWPAEPRDHRYSRSIDFGPDGTAVVVGYKLIDTEGEFPFGSLLWAAKFDLSEGEPTLLWEDLLEGPGGTHFGSGWNDLFLNTQFSDVAVDRLGNVYAIGSIMMEDDPPPPLDIYESDTLIRKYNPDGLSDGWPGP